MPLVSPTKPVSYKPTRKWMAAVLAGLGAIATLAVVQGVDTEVYLALIGLLVTQGTAYLVPNDPGNPASGTEA